MSSHYKELVIFFSLVFIFTNKISLAEEKQMLQVQQESALNNQEFECKNLYNEIEDDIRKSNYCQQDSDCDTLELGGPYVVFGCYHFVNKDTDKEKIRDKMKNYYQKCKPVINDCAPHPLPICINNKCQYPEVKNKKL